MQAIHTIFTNGSGTLAQFCCIYFVFMVHFYLSVHAIEDVVYTSDYELSCLIIKK